MHAAVIQATRSTPSRTQLTQYPSSRETIRQRNSRSGGRLPHFIGRCSTRARAGPLARRYPRWTLKEVPRNLPQLLKFESPRTSRHSRAQINATDRSGRPDNFTAKVDGEISRSTTSPDIAPSSKANARRKKQNNKIIRKSAETVAQTGDLALVKQ